MVSYNLGTTRFPYTIDLSVDQNTREIVFSAVETVRGNSYAFLDDASVVRISSVDLQNPDWLSSENTSSVPLTAETIGGNIIERILMNQESLFESWHIRLAWSSAFNRGEKYSAIFDAIKPDGLLGGVPEIIWHGHTTGTANYYATRFVQAHATSWYVQESDANNREIIEIVTGDGETHTGYGFNRPPERNGDDDRFNVPRPPSSSRLKSDHITYYTADLDGSNIGETTKTLVNNRYNVDIDINRPNVGQKQNLIRRQLLYVDGSFHNTAYYKYNEVEHKYFPDNTIGDGTSGLVVDPDSPFGVYDRIQAFQPQIDVGRCV